MDGFVLDTLFGGVEVRTDRGRLAELNLTDVPGTRTSRRNRVAAELARYFRGERVTFEDVEVDLGRATAFQRKVYEATRAIPYGKVATYGQIAKAIGKPNAQRAVGQALNRNPVAIVIPCHRVVASDGFGGLGSPSHWKRDLLRLEGVLR
ncbi:MAG: methylated-DNA--[protein]-cysteine S-methyltransferase [Methanobacteriota archaeon]